MFLLLSSKNFGWGRGGVSGREGALLREEKKISLLTKVNLTLL